MEISERDAESFEASRDDIIDKASAFLCDRFHGLGHDPILHAAATSTDHHSWPINNRQQMLICDKDAIRTDDEDASGLDQTEEKIQVVTLLHVLGKECLETFF